MCDVVKGKRQAGKRKDEVKQGHKELAKGQKGGGKLTTFQRPMSGGYVTCNLGRQNATENQRE